MIVSAIFQGKVATVTGAASGVGRATAIASARHGADLAVVRMNIEEKSFYESTKLTGKDLIHYHLCENDRGIPGTGLVDWDGIFQALGEIGYTGYAALESFVDCTDNMNTWVWRQLASSGDDLVREGVAFIRAMQEKYGLA